MVPPVSSFSIILALAGFLCAIVAAFIFRFRSEAPAAASLAVFLGALAWWELTYGLFWLGVPGPTPTFWLDLTYLGVVVVPPSFLLFSLRITGRLDGDATPLAIALVIEPIFVTILIWTDPFWGLFFGGTRGEGTGLILESTAGFWMNTVYSYALILVASGVLLATFVGSTGIRKKQLRIVLLGSLIPLASNLLLLFGITVIPNVDNTPFSFTVIALFLAYAVVRFRMLRVVPIAHGRLLELLPDPIVVFDAEGKVVDANPAARKVAFGSDHFREIAVLPDGQNEIEIGGEVSRLFSVLTTAVRNRRGFFLGRIAIGRDITDRDRAQRRVLSLLDEKNVLLREVHHRLKNNMATISSILSLQSGALNDVKAKAALEDAGNRLVSMSLLYERLYQSENVVETELDEYLSTLVPAVVSQYPANDRVEVRVETESIVLSADATTSAGIVVNELVNNAMRYAFEERSGVLLVSARMKDENVEIVVADTGPGIESLDRVADGGGFGSQLVSIITSQIGGTVTYENDGGLRVTVLFPRRS